MIVLTSLLGWFTYGFIALINLVCDRVLAGTCRRPQGPQLPGLLPAQPAVLPSLADPRVCRPGSACSDSARLTFPA